MTQINTDYEEDFDLFKTSLSDSSPVHVSKREDEETIIKTKSIEIPQLPAATNESLEGRVTIGKPIAEQLGEIDSDHFTAVESAIAVEEPVEANYMIRVRSLIASILVQLNTIAEKDRHQIDDMKKNYKKSTLAAATLQRELGSNGLKFSLVALGASFLQFLSPHQSDREIMNIFAREFCPKLGEMFSSGIKSNMDQETALAQLVLNEYSAKTQKGTNDSSNKQELIQILDRVLESRKRAAQSG